MTREEKLRYNREYSKLYRIRKGEELKQKSHQYYLDHKDEVNKRQKVYRTNTKELLQKYRKKYREENREKIREYGRKYGRDVVKSKKKWLKTRFNITLEEYNDLLLKQDNKCAICGRDRSEFKNALSVDHDHVTGKIRSLLCLNCNTGLGFFRDKIEILEKAINYLKIHLQ